jgi:hypothetical protein
MLVHMKFEKSLLHASRSKKIENRYFIRSGPPFDQMTRSQVKSIICMMPFDITEND